MCPKSVRVSASPPMKILLHGLNYAPEVLGNGKYSGEMMQFLAQQGHDCAVVTAPPYSPSGRSVPVSPVGAQQADRTDSRSS